MVIVPFMDNYELEVLKTLAICDYGVSDFPSCGDLSIAVLFQITFSSQMHSHN